MVSLDVSTLMRKWERFIRLESMFMDCGRVASVEELIKNRRRYRR